MSEIDWGKAPEWATHFGAETEKYNAAWYQIKGDRVVRWSSEDMVRSYNTGAPTGGFFPGLEDLVCRPEPWDGEGVPPVGIEFEYTTNAGYNWHKGRLLFLDSQVVLLHGYHLFKIDDPDLGFRPLRTPEQLEAEAREKALNELTAGYAPHTEILRQWAERAYDELGYRKQEAS